MRSSVLFWYWHISWRATIPIQYLQGCFNPPLKNSFHGAFSLTVGLTWLASVLVFEGPTSATILANIWVSEIPGNLPAAFSPSHSLLCLSNSLGKGGMLPEGTPMRGCFLQPTLGVTFVFAIWNGAATSQRSWWAFYFDVNCQPILD